MSDISSLVFNGNNQNTAMSALVANKKQTSVASQLVAGEKTQSMLEVEKNNGGFFGGIGYALEKIGLGFLSSIEGIWDFTAGGLAKLFGADDWAEQQFANDWVNYGHADEWYNPSEGWQFVGDVAGGIGTSIPAMATVAAAAAITYFSGGTLAPVAAGLIAGTVAGLGAAGNATKEAYKQTGELGGKEFGYGALVGITEGSIEGLSSAIGAGTGAVVKGITKSFGKEIAESATRQTLGKAVIKGFVGEAFEEGVSEMLNPVWARLTYDPNAKNATFQEIGYAALVGGLSGAIMGGVDVSVRNISSTARGNTIATEGKTDNVLKMAEQLNAYEQTNKTGLESFELVQNVYDELQASLLKTNGQVSSVKQKMLLGVLEKANTNAIFSPIVARSAENIVNNAETIAEKITAYGLTDSDGKALTFTAEQIRNGIDENNARSFSKALKTNDILRSLAVADATGQISLNTAKFQEATLMGQKLSSQADLNRFIETATESELKAVGEKLGIDNWQGITNVEFQDKITEFVKNGGVESYKNERLIVKDAESIGADTAKRLPKRLAGAKPDGITRYQQGDTQLAIIKNGDSYQIYDYKSKRLSNTLSLQEVNKVLRELNTQEQVLAERVKQELEQEAERRKQVEETDNYARENIADYNKLSAPNQSMVRAVIRQGRVAGIAEADVLSYARVSAHSGLNIAFNEDMCIVGKDTQTGENICSDGYYDPQNNRIVVNPNTNRTHEALLIHELDHAIRKTEDGRVVLEKGVKNMSQADKDAIINRYRNAGRGGTVELIEELNAHYSEGMLTNKNILEKLCETKPTLKEKILGFFKNSAKTYSEDIKLSKEAQSLYRKYKKLFDDFSLGKKKGGQRVGGNQGNNAMYTQAELEKISESKQSDTSKRFALQNIDYYTEKQYNNYGWVRTNDVLTKNQWSDFNHKFAQAKVKHLTFNKTANGEFIIPVNNEVGEQFGIDNVLVYAKGTTTNPTITKIIKIDLFDETSIDYVRSFIYESEARNNNQTSDIVKNYFREELISELSVRDFSSYQELKGARRNSGANNSTAKRGQNGRGDTSNNKNNVRYALSIDGKNVNVNVEETKNLVALHNLSEQSLLKVLKLGGFPMPSIAITKVDMSHSDFGDITVIFGRDTIDPQKSSKNKVYSKDAWTPIVPQIEYKANEKVHKKISDKYYELSRKSGVGYDMARPLYTFATDIENEIKRYGGEIGLISKLYNDTQLMNLFLVDTGKSKVEPISKEIITRMSEGDIIKSKALLNALGDSLQTEIGELPVGSRVQKYLDSHRADIIEALAEAYAEDWGEKGSVAKINEGRKYITENKKDTDLKKDILLARKYLMFGTETRRTEQDIEATESVIRKRVNQSEYRAWIDNLFSGIEEKAGIYNGKDPYTRSGNRKSFEALHYEHTLDNLVRAMLESDEKGGSGWHGLTLGQLQAKLSKEFKSIDEIKANADFLTQKDNDAYKTFSDTAEQMITEIMSSMVDEARYGGDNVSYWSALNGAEMVIGEIADNKLFTLEKIAAFMKREYSTAYRYNDNIGNKILGLFEYVSRMSNTDYFEAKPRRAVEFSEIKSVLIPNTASEKLRTQLAEKNIPFQEYDSTNESARSNTIMQMDDIRFALQEDQDSRRGGFSKAQRAKFVANNTKFKIYSRTDATEVINSILEERLVFDDKFGKLSGKSKAEVIDFLFTKLNSTEPAYQGTVALKIADYIIENTLLEDIYTVDKSEDMRVLSILRKYMHNINLSGIQGEIQYKFGKKNGINMLWGNTNATQTPDTIAQELAEEGIFFDSANEADIFFEMLDKYESAREIVNQKVESVKLKTFESEEKLKQLRQQIARDILLAYDEKGTQSKYGKLVEKYTTKIVDLRKQVKEAGKKNTLVNNIVDSAQYLRDIASKRSYVGAEVFNAPELASWLKELGKLKYRSDIRKASARTILLNYGKFYNVNNELLYDEDPNLNYIDNNVIDALNLIKKNETSTAPLSLEELQAAQVILASAKHLFKNYDQMILEGKKVSITQAATEGIEILKRSKNRVGKGFFNKIYSIFNKIVEPRVVVKALENFDPNGILTRAYKQLTDGETAAGLMYIDLVNEFDSFFEQNKKYKKRLTSEYVKVGSAELTIGQAVSLYELSKREQAKAGLYESGFSYLDKKGAKQSVKITEKNIQELAKAFTTADKEFIAIVEDFFNVKSKQVKTDADLQILGYTNAQDDFYFPIKRDSGTIAKNVTDARSIMSDWANVYNFSFNKDVKAGSKNKLFVTDVYDIISRHAKQLSTYANLTVPLKNISQLYVKNVGSKTDVQTIKSVINEQVWDGADKYLTKLFADIQGSATSNSFIEKLRGAYAKYQLGANLKVIVSQVTSYPTAGVILDIDAMAKGAVMKTDYKALDEYCPYAKVRNYEKGVVRAEGVIDKVGKVGDILTKPIQWTDRLTIGKLWNACQLQVQKDNGLKVGTTENMKAAGVLLEEVVRLTQPNYTNTERSELMRSDSDLVRSFTMFTSVPLKQLSRLVEAVGEFNALRQMVKSGNASTEVNARYKVAKRKLGRTLAAITVANLMYVLVGQFFKWLYDKDRKDKDGNEISVATDMFNDFVSTNIGMLPVVKDIYNFFVNDYEFTNFAYETIEAVLSSSKELFELATKAANGQITDKSEYMRPFRNALYSMGQITGIPTRNINNLISGLIKRVDPATAYKYNSMFYNAKYSHDIKEALAKGDYRLADTIMNLMLNEDKTGGLNATARQKLMELYEKEYTVLPKSFDNSVTYNGEKVDLNKEQRTKFKQVYSQASKQIEQMIESNIFKGLSEDKQAKAIKQLFDAYYDKALSETLGVEVDSKLLDLAKFMDIATLSAVYAGMSDISSDKDRTGNTITGSKKRKLIKYLRSQNLKDEQILLLLAYQGYKVQDREFKGMSAQQANKKLLKYILSVKSTTQAQKARLAEKCGFEVRNGRVITKSI